MLEEREGGSVCVWGEVEVLERYWKEHTQAHLLHFLLGQEHLGAPTGSHPNPQLLAQHFSLPTLFLHHQAPYRHECGQPTLHPLTLPTAVTP